MTAYGITAHRLSGPAWLDTELYDIAANIPADATQAQFKIMLRNLLNETLVGRPIIDETGLTAEFDFKLGFREWVCRSREWATLIRERLIFSKGYRRNSGSGSTPS